MTASARKELTLATASGPRESTLTTTGALLIALMMQSKCPSLACMVLLPMTEDAAVGMRVPKLLPSKHSQPGHALACEVCV